MVNRKITNYKHVRESSKYKQRERESSVFHIHEGVVYGV